MDNYGCSSCMALHDAFHMKSGATVAGDAARAQEYRERQARNAENSRNAAEVAALSLKAKAVVEAAAADVGGVGVDYEGGAGCLVLRGRSRLPP